MRKAVSSPARVTRVRAPGLRLFGSLALVLLAVAPPAPAAVLKEVLVTPTGVTLRPGEIRQFFATALYSDGATQDITANAEWTTGDSRIARLSADSGTPGAIEARGPGTVEVRAALVVGEDKTKGATIVSVDAGEIISIETRPSSKNLDVGRPEQFLARANYETGYSGDVSADCTWSSSDPSKALVDSTGLVTPLEPTQEVILRVTHLPSGLQNTIEDGKTRIRARITHIDFDEKQRPPQSTTLGVGMLGQLDVYAYRVDGTRSKITRDIDFAIEGQAGVIDVYEDEESPEYEAGAILALGNGSVTVRASDPGLELDVAEGARVVVAGVLERLEILPDPFTVDVGSQRTPKVFGRLSSGASTPDLRKKVSWAIEDPEFAFVGDTSDDFGKVTGIKGGQTFLRATEPGTGFTSDPTLVEVRPPIIEISIEPSEIVLGENMALPLRAYGNRSDLSRSNVTNSVVWEVSPPEVASLASGGLLTSLASGTATVRAVLDPDAEDPLISPAIPLLVEGSLEGILILPNRLKIQNGQTRKARAYGELSTGSLSSELTEAVDWRVHAPSIAQVGNGTSGQQNALDRGEVLGLEAGVTTLTATETTQGLSSTAFDNILVRGSLDSVKMDDGKTGIVPISTPTLYKARATYSDGSKNVINELCEWSSDDPTVATVQNTSPGKGEVTGRRIGGQTIIRALCQGIEATGWAKIAGDIVRLTLKPTELEGKVLRTKRFRAIATYEGDFDDDITGTVDWTSTDPAVVFVNNDPERGDRGQVTLTGEGTASIIATANSGHIASAEVVVSGKVASIRIRPDKMKLRGGLGKRARAIGKTRDGDETNISQIVTWTTSDATVADLGSPRDGPGLIVGGSRAGNATITASLDALAGTFPPATMEVIVGSVLQDFQLKPPRRRIRTDQVRRVFARGTFSDGKSKPITRYVEFTSDDPGIAKVIEDEGRRGRILGVAPGTTTIRAFDPRSGIQSSQQTSIEVIPR